MAQFTDASGRDWEVLINVGTVGRIKSECDINVLTILDDQAALYVRLHSDPVLLCSCLAVACNVPEAKREEFFKALLGDAIADGERAFFEALVDFFPSQEQRTALRMLETKVRSLAKTMRKLSLERATKTMEEIDTESEAIRLIDSVGNGAASLG